MREAGSWPLSCKITPTSEPIKVPGSGANCFAFAAFRRIHVDLHSGPLVAAILEHVDPKKKKIVISDVVK